MTVGHWASMAMLLTVMSVRPTGAQGTSVLDWTLVPFVGMAQRSPVGAEWGVTPDRDHLLLGLQLETSVLRLGRARVLFAPQFIPLARLSHSPSAGSTEDKQPAAYGAGFVPFGLALQLPAGQTVQLFANAAVGALWFTAPVPVPDARAFNVTIEWGGGVDLPIGSRRRLRLGYKFHHLSNAYSAAENPGVDGHIFYAGWPLRVTAPR